jgi:hypothetical protein
MKWLSLAGLLLVVSCSQPDRENISTLTVAGDSTPTTATIALKTKE